MMQDSKVQHSLRRTMEKYSAACRLILCCSSASKVIEAVRSRCLNVRINSPSRDEVSFKLCDLYVDNLI